MSHLLTFETLHNTRDLGGMLTADGRKIRSGKLIRSGRLSDLSDNDREELAGILDIVVDFRDEAERLEHPDTELEGVTYIHLPLLEELAAGVTRDERSEHEMLAKTVNSPENAMKMICNIYSGFVMREYVVSQYRKFLQILLENHDKAVLWHCSGGKDRAGIGAALVEEILGVSRKDVIADYMETNDYISKGMDLMMQDVTQKVPEGTKVSREALEYLYFAKQEYIDTYYQAVEQSYGDFLTFLSEGMQLTEGDISRLREMYLE